MPFFGGGETEAAEAAKQEKADRKNRYRPGERYLKDGDNFYGRVITERFGRNPWIPTETHLFIPTKTKPSEVTWTWRDQQSAICRNGRIFRLRDEQGNKLPGYEEGYGNCWICSNLVGETDQFGQDLSKPRVLTYALAVLREPVTDPASPDPDHPVETAFKDVMAEWRPFGAKTSTRVPNIVLFAQPYDRFWASVSAACYGDHQSVCDKDYRIQKIGKEIKITMVNITDNHKPGLPSWQRYEEALKILGFSLEGYLLERSSEDHYKRWFIPGATPEGGYGFASNKDDEEAGEKASSGATTPTQPSVAQEDVEAYRARLAERRQAASTSA